MDILSQITIRPIEPKDDLNELTLLINRAYKKLADQGFRYKGSYQDTETTKHRIEKGKCLVALLNDKLVGTSTYYPPLTSSAHPWFQQPFVARYGQYAVEPEFQNIGIGSMLATEMELLAIQNNATEITIDTAEGATALINYYTKKGYRHVGFIQWNDTNYRSVLLSKKLVI